jgi:hypothetical protein
MKRRLTNEQIIQRAVKFIGDATCQQGILASLTVDARAKAMALDSLQRSEDRRPLECWRALLGALDQIDSAEGEHQRAIVTKNKKTLEPFEAALRRLRAEFKKLPDALRYPLLSTQFDEHCRVWLDVCKKLREGRRPNKPKRDDGFRQRVAAEHALILLRKFKSDVEIRTVSDGHYCDLAAVLYGDPKADLRRYCREQLQVTKPG